MGAAQPTTGGSLFSSFTSTQPTTPYSTVNPYANETDAQRNERIALMTGRAFTRGGMGLRQDGNAMPTALPTYAQLTDDGYGSLARERIGAYGGGYGGFNPMMGGGIGAFGDRGFMGYR
jgi:predicted dienelactone hydrolase